METDYLKVLEIAAANDLFRQTGLGTTITTGVQDLPDVEGLMERVRDFDRFTEDNDPYGEHDFGRLEWYGQTVYWKIDYYNRQLRTWEDPYTSRCQRVLTVMLAEEY